MKVGDRVKIVIEGRLDYLDDSGLKINGKVYDTGEYSHIEKLSSEQPTLILEPGKEYLAAPDWRMRCISDLRMEGNGEHPIVMEWYSKDKGWKGPFYYKKDGTHKYEEHNIIGPWNPNPKPVVDWSLHSKWTKAVAQISKNRIWRACNSIPLKAYDYYYVDGLNISLKIPPEYAPKNADGTPWVGNWEDSLVVREEE
jgi:hypothetical protein